MVTFPTTFTSAEIQVKDSQNGSIQSSSAVCYSPGVACIEDGEVVTKFGGSGH